MPRDVDLIGAISTKMPASWSAGVGLTEYDLRIALMDIGVFPKTEFTFEPRNYCGGEGQTAHETLKADIAFPVAGKLVPKLAGWLASYVHGGGSGYTVAGASDPWTHTAKQVRPPDEDYDWFSLLRWFQGSGTYSEFLGCTFNRWGIAASHEAANGALLYSGEVFTRGNRALYTSGVTEPTCVEENAYRIGDGTLSFGPHSTGVAISGLDWQAWSFAGDNKLVTDGRRSGLYLALPFEYGNREYTSTLVLKGTVNDTVEQLYENRTAVFMNVVQANPTASRVFSIFGLKGTITSLEPDYFRSIRSRVHRLTIQWNRDETNATTIANSPVYMTAQSPVATYRRV